MVSEVWIPVMRTLAHALAQADDDKMKRMGSSLSKDVVKMHSSSNNTNLLMKTTARHHDELVKSLEAADT